MQDVATEHNRANVDGKAVYAEQRVNLIRIFAIIAFYLVNFGHFLSGPATSSLAGSTEESIAHRVQVSVAILCFGWLMQAFAIHLMIARRWVPAWLPALVTVGDLVWLTLLLCVSTGPSGPMVVGYFLIIILSGVRFDLRLVRWTTVLAMMGYLVLLGVTRWPRGMFKELDLQSVPPYHEIMILVAMTVSGIIIGQIVRQSYLLDEDDGPSDQEGVA